MARGQLPCKREDVYKRHLRIVALLDQGWTAEAIARLLGYRDHTSVLYHGPRGQCKCFGPRLRPEEKLERARMEALRLHYAMVYARQMGQELSQKFIERGLRRIMQALEIPLPEDRRRRHAV